jgi:hypothetical protein
MPSQYDRRADYNAAINNHNLFRTFLHQINDRINEEMALHPGMQTITGAKQTSVKRLFLNVRYGKKQYHTFLFAS